MSNEMKTKTIAPGYAAIEIDGHRVATIHREKQTRQSLISERGADSLNPSFSGEVTWAREETVWVVRGLHDTELAWGPTRREAATAYAATFA